MGLQPFFNPLPETPLGAVATLLFKSVPQGFVSPGNSAGNANNPTPGQTGPVSLSIDVIDSENPHWTAQPTNNPIENGQTVNDHVRVLPRGLRIRGMISDATMAGQFLIGIVTGSASKVQDALKFIDAAITNALPADFVSGLAVYRNMVITSAEVDRQAKTSRAVRFTMELQEVIIAASQFVTQQNNSSPAFANSATPGQNVGKQSPSAATPGEAAAAGSVKATLAGVF